MTVKRAGGYAVVFALLAAWLSSAAGVIGQPERVSKTPPRSREAIATDAIAFDVQAQTERLKHRLATAPVPQQPIRNPFVFYSRPPAPRSAAAPRPLPPAAEPIVPDVPAEPELTLIGVAEEKKEQGIVRTALLSGPGEELLMAGVGQTVLGRYTVTAIGPDAVELRDISSDRIRRLGLK